MITIAVDCMGGDHGPRVTLPACTAFLDQHPDAEFIAHPECEKPVLLVAKYIGSTTALLNYVAKSPSKKFIVATESGILHQMN